MITTLALNKAGNGVHVLSLILLPHAEGQSGVTIP